MQLAFNRRPKFFCRVLFISVVVFLHLSVGLLTVVTEVQQQGGGNVIQTTAILSEARCCLVSTSSGELVFFGGGWSSTGPSDRVDIYNVTSGSWTTATLSIPRAELAATSSQNLVFFGGGRKEPQWPPTTVYDRVDIYNTLNGSWSTAALSQPRSRLAATSVGNLVLFGGGVNSTGHFKVVDVFDVTNNTWTIATLSQARGYLAATSVDNRYALFAGGWIGSGPSNFVDIFDSLSEMWNTTTLSQARWDLAATSLGNLAFFGGGLATGNQPASNVIDIFNSTSQTWSTVTLSQARYGLATSSIGEIVAFGGGWNGSTHYSVVDMLNVTSNIWFTLNLSQSRYYLVSSSSTNKIIFGGGNNQSGISNVVDIFEIPLPPPPPPPPPIVSPTVQSTTSSTTTPTNSSSPTSIIPSSPSQPSQTPAIPNIPTLIFTTNSPSLSSLTTNSPQQLPSSLPTSLIDILPSFEPNSADSIREDEFNVSGLVGGLIAAIVVIVAAIVILIVLLRRRRKRKSHSFKFKLVNERRPSQVGLEPIPFNELQLQETIGYGSYGKVERAKWKNTDVVVRFCTEKGTTEEFENAAKVLIDLPPHPNVVRFYGISFDGQQTALVLEYCSGGTLQEKLGQVKPFEIVKGIVEGMIHLHKHNIVHGNLTSKNILLTKDDEPKISDYGLLNLAVQTGAGPLRWMAPESLKDREFTLKSDVWMFGVVVWEIVTQQKPYQDIDDVHIITRPQESESSQKLQIPDECPKVLKEIMEKCWQIDPHDRPTFEEIRLKLKREE